MIFTRGNFKKDLKKRRTGEVNLLYLQKVEFLGNFKEGLI